MAHASPMQRTTDDLLTRAEAAIAEAKALRHERERLLATARMWTCAPQIALRQIQTEFYEDGGFMIGPQLYDRTHAQAFRERLLNGSKQ